MKIYKIRLASALVILLIPVAVTGAGFNCKKSQTFIENAICRNKGLSKLDDKLSEAYNKALKIAFAPDVLKQEQCDWLTNERNVCQDIACLKGVYEQRLESLATYDERQRAATGEGSCEFTGLKLQEEYSIFAAGGYSGREINFQIDQSGHQATQMDVIVNCPSKPAVLMLGAYEPTIWNISRSPATRIVAVLVSGYHRQAVAGLDATVPILNTSYENKGPCGYFYVEENNLGDLNPMSRRLFGRPVDMVYLAKGGKIMIGEQVPEGIKLITSATTPPESFYDKTAPLAGLAGLEDAVQKGFLRRATDSDADAWVEAARANVPKRDVPPIAGQGDMKPNRPSLFVTDCIISEDDQQNCKRRYNAYVVLKQFIYPAGLYGEATATFFIPKGVPRPKGNPGHSEVYDFNNLK